MPSRRRRGFTLIEVLVVMAIVALLASIALPRFFGSLQVARERALEENLRVLRVSIDRFHGDKGRYPADLEELVAQRYLAKVPIDPVTESADTWVVMPSADDDTGIADVRSGAPGSGRNGRSFAEY